MKFLTRINRNYLLLFLLTLLGIMVAVYFALRVIIVRNAKEKLLSNEYLVESQIRKTGDMPNLHPLVEVRKVAGEPDVSPSFNEVSIRNEIENEDEIFLEYSYKVKINDSWYLVKLRQSEFESKDLILILALTLFALLFSAFIISYFITRRMNKTVWAGFEHNLHQIENYSMDLGRDISLVQSDIEEFERLNRVINDFTLKLKSDFLMLKEFSENASHEIQTPLSVALLNLEEIMQDDLTKDTFAKVAATANALKRLSSLNRSLILLTKIDNRQFEIDRSVSFYEIAKRKADEFSGLLEAKTLTLEITADNDFVVKMNEELSEILIGNLFSNAVNHNITGGKIRITVSTGSFVICNQGESNQLTDKTIFNRFTRGNPGSYGLGLAIVKRICEMHGLDINYHKGELHCFTIKSKS